MGIIGIMTDFGMRGQHYIAEMKGIALQINSDVQIIDISHTITHYSRIESAYMIFTIYNKFPKGSIFVCVIDPGVGTEREIVVIETKDGYYLVGPDNGIFSYFQIQNLIKNCFIAENSSYFNPPYAKALETLLNTSDKTDTINKMKKVQKNKNDEINPYIYTETFHGRDIMMPIGAYLSKGVLPKEFGPKKPILSVVLDLLPDLSLDERFLKGKILYIDSFGNIITNIHIPYFRSIMVSQPILQLDYGEEKYPLKHVPTFAGNNKYDYLLIDGSSGFIEICQNQSNAAESLDAHVEDEFTIEFLGGLLH